MKFTTENFTQMMNFFEPILKTITLANDKLVLSKNNVVINLAEIHNKLSIKNFLIHVLSFPYKHIKNVEKSTFFKDLF